MIRFDSTLLVSRWLHSPSGPNIMHSTRECTAGVRVRAASMNTNLTQGVAG